MNKYILGQTDAPADYRDSKTAAETLVNESVNKITTYKGQMHTLFSERGATPSDARFPNESSETIYESRVRA